MAVVRTGEVTIRFHRDPVEIKCTRYHSLLTQDAIRWDVLKHKRKTDRRPDFWDLITLRGYGSDVLSTQTHITPSNTLEQNYVTIQYGKITGIHTYNDSFTYTVIGMRGAELESSRSLNRDELAHIEDLLGDFNPYKVFKPFITHYVSREIDKLEQRLLTIESLVSGVDKLRLQRAENALAALDQISNRLQQVENTFPALDQIANGLRRVENVLPGLDQLANRLQGLENSVSGMMANWPPHATRTGGSSAIGGYRGHKAKKSR